MRPVWQYGARDYLSFEEVAVEYERISSSNHRRDANRFNIQKQ